MVWFSLSPDDVCMLTASFSDARCCSWCCSFLDAASRSPPPPTFSAIYCHFQSPSRPSGFFSRLRTAPSTFRNLLTNFLISWTHSNLCFAGQKTPLLFCNSTFSSSLS
jgi:hypothetical protein